MFDIAFFKNTYGIKREIVANRYVLENAGEIFSALEQHRSPKPHLFSIETTNNCNMTCVMCPRTTEMTRKIENMRPEIFERVAEQITPHAPGLFKEWTGFVENELGIHQRNAGENSFYFFISSQAVTMHGFGEPLFDPLLNERVAILTDKSIPSYFSCNPSNININKIDKLFKAGLKYIKFSIDSISDDKMKEVRGRQADFSGAMKKILQVLDIKEKGRYPATIVACMIKMDKDQDPEAEEFIRTWKGKDVYAYIKSLDNQWYVNDPDRDKAQSHYESQYCEFAWTSMSVMVDGSVVPCTQDFNCEMKMGNVMEQSLEEIWNSDKYKEFRMMHITGDVPKEYRCKERCDLKLVADYLTDKTINQRS